MIPRRFRLLFIIVLCLLCFVQIEGQRSKGRRSLSRRPTRSSASDNVNILFVRATTVDVGFRYVQGAKRFFVSAREWVDGKSIGNEAFQIWLRDQDRTATLRNLNPGREYVILVQAWGESAKVGLQARTVVRMSQQCYVCNGKPSNEDCQGDASVKECPHDKDACLNELRYSKGVPKLTKRCAQWRPELGKQIQNGKDVTTACTGRENVKDAACKCMCRSNLCNELEMPCINECFKELPVPENSYLRCTNAEKVGSICRWFCLPGYRIQGRRASDCRKDRTWSVLNPPECVVDDSQIIRDLNHTCPALVPPEHSYMSCTNKNNPASVCTFSCTSGHLIKGSYERTCDGSTSKWSGEQPSCVEIKCQKIEELDGLSKECTANETTGSVCEFSCPEDRKLVGKSSLTCLPAGRWSSVIPRCTALDCAIEPKIFPNVVMECSQLTGKKKGRVCHFSCKEGFERVGASSTFCYTKNSWTNSSPQCKRTQCRPQMYAPAFGFVRCNDLNYYGSKCVFSCVDGYMLQGKESTVCGNGGKWSNKIVPTCKKIKCPPINNFNGLVSCNSGLNYGSSCRFSCKRGFGLKDGSVSKVKCVGKTPNEVEATRRGAELGKWDGPIPRCFVVGCSPLGKPPAHSTLKCSGPQTTLGTICTYTCNKGYNLVGSARTICQSQSYGGSSGQWSSLPPVCERVTCEVLPEINYGTIRCTDGNFAASECKVECDYARFISGKETIVCGLDGSWSNKLAICRLITCSGKPTLRHGAYNCGEAKKFTFNHECKASCNSGYELKVSGAAVCGIKGNWLISDEVICKDKNECENLDADGEPTNGGCEQTCENTVGSYHCDCFDDYKLNADGKTCKIQTCSSLGAVMKGRVGCTNTNRIGSVCSLRCIPGFETTDVDQVTCLRNGQWSDEIGLCTRISCPVLEIAAFGFMECSLGYKFGSNCDFECKPGYELRGKESIRCGADGKWTAPIPICQKKMCDIRFVTLTNGIVKCSDRNRFESMCESSCEEGYELERISSDPIVLTVKVHCLADATWSEKKPKCIKKRCEPRYEELLSTREHSEITCTDDDWLGSTCELSCGKGYQVTGNYKVKCVGDAHWSKSLGTCIKVQCSTLAAPSNGQMSCTEDSSYQSTCSFSCNEGYEMEGESQTDCRHNRKWTNTPLTCNRKKCSQTYAKLLKGMVKCTEENFYGSICEFRCSTGYEFADTTTDIRKAFGAGLNEGVSYEIVRLSCDATGVWSGEKPVCQRHECIPPSIVLKKAEPNGNIQCSDGDKFESVCELSCIKGYEIVGGGASIQCMDDREWKPKLGNCARVRCPMFTPLVNGVTKCTNSNFYESQCLFGCYPGYKLNGSPVSRCQADRTFTINAPTCEKIECPKTHTKLEYGSATCSDGVRYESECVYVCNSGYEMIMDGEPGTEESVILKCSATGTWGGKLPTCRRRRCSIHDGAIAKARQSGNVKCSEGVWYQSVCTVDCDPGFKLVGSSSTRCTADADWGPTLGYCERRTCPAMETPDHGSMECTNGNKFESICKFKCDYGYELIGFEESKCLALEYFSSAAPSCREIVCSIDFLKLEDGEVECSNKNKFDSRCLYKCNEGYQLTSTSADTLDCMEAYTWSENKPECERKVCPQGDAYLVRAAELGKLTCTNSNKYQSVCSVICYTGYELTQGAGHTICQADQGWGPNIGYCTKISCEEFDPVENGTIKCTDSLHYQSICSFSCDPGFELTHSKTSTCQANRTFSVIPPECRKITCSSWHMKIHNGLTDCTDGNKFGSICKYKCHRGFERVSGSASAQCLADGTWNAQKTGCERIHCDGSDILFVKARENGEVSCTSHYYYGSVCMLKCNEGYELTGMTVGETQCNDFGQWDGELGYCTRIFCEKYDEPSNGNMSCTNENRFQSECVFICHTGYKMNGESRTTCNADRTWTNKKPACEKIKCSPGNLFLENGSANCTERNRYLSVCWYGCDPGYEMDEDVPYAMCTSSRAWTRNKPTCVKIECNYGEEMITKALQNGKISCTDGVRYQSVCSLTCTKGYERVGGGGIIECTAAAIWKRNIGYCQRIRCDSLEPPANSKMDCTDENKFESVCAFVCEDGYEMEGEQETECLANKIFSNTPPACIKSKCSPQSTSIHFGLAVCTDSEYFMSVCSYECLAGYRMYGDHPVVKSECLSNQTWSAEIPICEKETCPYDARHLLKALEHGDVSCTEGNRYQSKCSLICDLGYVASGYKKIVCTDMGTWSNPIGQCQKIKCDRLSTPSSAIKSCTDEEFFNSSCSFSCEGGYTFSEKDFMLEEEITLTCSVTQTWTSPTTVPECIKSTCPRKFVTVLNGNITCSDGAYYGSQCLIKCDDGYELVNPSDDFDVTTVIITCLANATWDVTLQPVCKKVKCKPDMTERSEEMIHGKIKCTDGSNFASKCEVACNKGYEVFDGAPITRCLRDRSWEPLLGRCDKNSCPSLVAPEDATLQCDDGFRFKSKCKLICRPGFEIYDPENDYDDKVGLECKADGDWCGDVPTCTRIRCAIENLSMDGGVATCSNNNLFESKCVYSCNPGYQMRQGEKDVTTCTAHMLWSNPKPTCEKRRCPANDTSIKEAQVNGEVTCSEENRFDSQCELHCAQGFELSGEQFTTCLHSGVWSNGIGLCNKIRCKEPEVPRNAIVKCSDKNKFKTFCKFECKTGYMLTEKSVKDGNGIVCQADGTWEGEYIQCEKITCPAEGYVRIDDGLVYCNDSNFFMSRCLFECDGGHELVQPIDTEDPASTIVSCTERGFWDVSSPPKCKPIQCDPIEKLQEQLKNGAVHCTKGSEFRSQCRARCFNGYELVGGESITFCGEDKKWGPTFGMCQKISCSDLDIPKHGRMVCDDGFRYMSQCVFDCLSGYEMVTHRKNTGTTTCRADRTWIGQPPTCEMKKCDVAYFKLEDGRVICSDKNNFDSECEFTCDEGFELSGPNLRLATCQESGKWNIEKPSCRIKTCKSAYATNGYMNCTGSDYNAGCRLTCEIGHILQGSEFSTCADVRTGETRWNPPIGNCEKVTCKEPPMVRRGLVPCSDSNRFRSACYVNCERGYQVKGITFSTRCLSNGKWSREFQSCERVTCDSSYLDVEYGRVTSSDGNNFASTLRYFCPKIGYKFTGMSEVTCLDNGKWSRRKPRCERVQCPPINLPNGQVLCSGQKYNDYQSKCSYVCNYNYERIGSEKTECQLDGTWTNSPPYCKGHCDIRFSSLQNGGSECTNSNYRHSRCRFWCNSQEEINYSIYGNDFLTCKANGRWDGMPPCCARSCIPHGKMDLFFVFHSSSDIRYENWRKLLQFATQILDNFEIGDDNVLAGALRYHREVDSRNEIPIGKLKEKSTLKRAIEYMQLGGWGTNTGQALEHLVTKSIKQPGNRPDVMDTVILFVSDTTQDEVKSAVEKLKALNVTVYVIGIQNSAKKLDCEQLIAMASSPAKDHISIVKGGFKRISAKLSEGFAKKLCSKPCLHNRKYWQEAGSYILREEDESVKELTEEDFLI